MRLLTLALCIALASGCAGGAPTVPSEGLATPTPSPANPFTGGGGDLDRPMGRTGAGDISGTVTLNGATTTNPTYQTAPFKVAQDGRADDIALFALNAIAIPAANNAVRTHFDGASTAYGFLDYPTTGTTGYLALYLTKSELISLTFLNSPTLATPLHSQAVKWAGSFRTIGREDAFEADDDENAASLGDRPANAPLLGTAAPITRSFFRRTAVTNQDQEDWVRVTLNAGTRYRIDLTNSNGTYASWTYALKLVTAGGGVAQSRTDITGTTAFMEIQPDTTQTYHLQISAVPTSRRGNSVYYAEYTLSMTAVPVPEITAVTPTGLIGALDQRVTFKATATGSPTAWQWTFSGGVDPLTSTAAQPTVLLVTPGTYSGTVTATTSAGTSAPFAFQYTVPTTIVPFRTTNVHGGVVGQPAVGFDNSIVLLPPYYFAIAYRESPDNRLFVAVSQSFDPFATSADWTIHTVDTAAVRDPSMVMHNGRLAIAYYDGANSALKVARATVDEPDAATDWVIHTVESADTVGGDPSLLSGGGFLGVAYERVAGTDFGIRYARATVITPSSAGDWVTMRVTPATADYEEPGVVWQNNRPVIAYRKFEEDAEGLFVAQTPTGTPSATTDWSSHLVEGGDTGHALSLIELNGRVAMSYLNNPSKAVRVARALTVSPASTSDWVRTNVHNGGVNTMSLGTSLALVDGRMALTYASPYGLTLRLRVARALVPEPTQTSQWLLATADPATFTGGYSSLTSYNGRLAIAHSRSFQDGGHSMRFSYAQEPF